MAKKALIAMSGGVDSSVAALQMLQAGYDCIGATMRLHDVGEDPSAPMSTAAQEAQAVAQRLGFPFYELDWRQEFAACVMDPFVAEYERGRTPNPCILCNRHMKFAGLHRFAKEQGCELVVTGHYARVVYDEQKGRYTLRKARNLAKDQSYVLYNLTQEQLAHTAFPLGEMEDKEQVRAMAAACGFDNAHKKDSQDICFIPDGRYADFIRRRTGRDYPAGDFVDETGRVLGQHKGLIGYTVGQRRGLGLSLPAPLYVQRKCVENNTVVLAPESALYTTRLIAEDVNWIAGEPPATTIRAAARTRYSAKEALASITPLQGERVEILFDTPQRAVTIGQAVVLYEGDEVLGGGTICEV